MIFTDKFTKSLAALLYRYNEAPIGLKNEDMQKYLEAVVENGRYISECSEGCSHKFSDLTFWKDFFEEGYPRDIFSYSSRNAYRGYVLY